MEINYIRRLKILLKNNFYSDAFFRAKNIWGRELRLYPMIRGMVDEAIISVVILLGFIIFCSYFLERILLGSGSTNARVFGFMGFFFLGALVLFFLHPAFQLSSSPIIILIAYSLAGFGILTITTAPGRSSIVYFGWDSIRQRWFSDRINRALFPTAYDAKVRSSKLSPQRFVTSKSNC